MPMTGCFFGQLGGPFKRAPETHIFPSSHSSNRHRSCSSSASHSCTVLLLGRAPPNCHFSAFRPRPRSWTVLHSINSNAIFLSRCVTYMLPNLNSIHELHLFSIERPPRDRRWHISSLASCILSSYEYLMLLC